MLVCETCEPPATRAILIVSARQACCVATAKSPCAFVDGLVPGGCGGRGLKKKSCSCDCAYDIVTAVLLGLVQAEAQKLRLRTGRDTYHVVGMVPFNGTVFNRKNRPALAQYLTQEVSTKFDSPVKFTIRFEVCSRLQPRPVRLSSGARGLHAAVASTPSRVHMSR